MLVSCFLYSPFGAALPREAILAKRNPLQVHCLHYTQCSVISGVSPASSPKDAEGTKVENGNKSRKGERGKGESGKSPRGRNTGTGKTEKKPGEKPRVEKGGKRETKADGASKSKPAPANTKARNKVD